MMGPIVYYSPLLSLLLLQYNGYERYYGMAWHLPSEAFIELSWVPMRNGRLLSITLRWCKVGWHTSLGS